MIVPYKLPIISGNEFIGIVEKIGEQVSKFNIGDRVFARMPLNKIGTFAEYISVEEEALAKVPEYLTSIEAAAIFQEEQEVLEQWLYQLQKQKGLQLLLMEV